MLFNFFSAQLQKMDMQSFLDLVENNVNVTLQNEVNELVYIEMKDIAV